MGCLFYSLRCRLSLRLIGEAAGWTLSREFPFLFGRAFIEVRSPATMIRMMLISLLSSGDLHRGDSRAKRPASIARHFSVSQRRLSLRYLGRRCNSDHRLQFPIFS